MISVERNIWCRINNLFESNKPSSYNSDRTVYSLVPTLISSIICGNGELSLHSEEDISNAIVTGIILVSASDADVTGKPINIKETEPLVYNTLKRYISKVPIDTIMNLVLNHVKDGSGCTAEEIFSYWIALTTYSTMKNNTSNKNNGMLLGELLYPLYGGDVYADFRIDFLNQYECAATNVSNLKNDDFFHMLNIVRNKMGNIESIRKDTIYFNINKACGVDIVFIVKRRDESAYKLVAIHSKNDQNITIKDALITLSPGTQYLDNTQREYILNGKSYKPTHPLSEKWGKWCTFCQENDDSVGSSWIRIVLVSRNIKQKIYNFVGTEQFLKCFNAKVTKRYWTLFASKDQKLKRKDRNEKAVFANMCSPLFILSLSSKNWLNGELKKKFVNINESDSDIDYPIGRKESVYWIPATVLDAMNKLK